MKDRIQKLITSANGSIEKIKTAKATADTFVARRAELRAEADQFVDNHDFSLDAKSLAKVASLNGGIALAKACEPRLLRLLNETANAVRQEANKLAGGIQTMHSEITDLIEASLLEQIPVDLREGFDVLGTSKAFRAEVIEREKLGGVPGGIPGADEDSQMAAALLAHLLEYLERCVAELNRSSATVARYTTKKAA